MISKLKKLFGKSPKVLVVEDTLTPLPKLDAADLVLPVPPEHVRHAETMPPPRALSEAPIKMPSKSRLLRLLREGFGPATRFQTKSDGTVEIWSKVSGSNFPIVSIKARAQAGERGIYFIAACAAFRSLGFALELYHNRIEIVPFNPENPRHANSQVFEQ